MCSETTQGMANQPATGGMKLSDAIRLGAMLHPQGFGGLWDLRHDADGNAVIVASCALGAAYEAGVPDEVRLEEVMCPACHGDGYFVYGLFACIAHLNDDHRWTREAIADQVEIWEQAQAQQEAAEPVLCGS